MYYGEEQKEEIRKHLKCYVERKDADVLKDLIPCCERCEEYCGEEHDFNECSNCPILEMWYELKYWRWYGSYC